MKRLLPLLLVCTTLTACQKGDDPLSPSKTALLTAKSWRLAAYTVVSVSNGHTSTVDAYATEPACRRDDFMNFRRDQSILYDEGAVKCNPTVSQTATGLWEWADDEKTLTYLASSVLKSSIKFELVELTASTLRLRYTRRQYIGSDSSTEEWTYQAF